MTKGSGDEGKSGDFWELVTKGKVVTKGSVDLKKW